MWAPEDTTAAQNNACTETTVISVEEEIMGRIWK